MFADPENNIKQFKLGEGMIVADLGSGSGFYTLAAARAVGGNGKVYAVDVQKELLSRVKNDAIKEHLSNVEVIWGNIEKIGGTKLSEQSVDAVIVSNTLFQLQDKKTFAEEVRRILKPEGKILVIDWSESFGGLGPDPMHIVSADSVKNLFEQAGFTTEESIPAGANHYGIIFRK